MINIQMVIPKSKLEEFEVYLQKLNGTICLSFPRGDFFVTKVDIPRSKKEELLDSQIHFLND